MDLAETYARVRAATEALAAPLSAEDCALQSMPDASPVKWHLAHTTWFFETLVLEVALLGVHHEQQHQELILTDLKHAFSRSPLRPAYRAPRREPGGAAASPQRWLAFDEGLREIGCGASGFAFDNERPRHRVFVEAFELATRPVTNAEYQDFVRDGGYARPDLWLSDGFAAVRAREWRAPLYWEERDGEWRVFTLAGPAPLRGDEPVCHLSLYEADAFARWAGARLPTEAEWECAAQRSGPEGGFAESGRFHPAPSPAAEVGASAMLGDVWEWTSSAYCAYPGFRPLAGSLGEYNGKFMSNQIVLRGGSCATPRSHIRSSYRNFFPPDARWQFSGIRLARDRG